MNSVVLEQKEIYHEVNSITGSAGSVIFGTTSLSELPVAELVHDFGLNISVCNRSVEDAVIADAFELLDECVFELHPRKVFLNFGETDMARSDFDTETFLADYERLVSVIRENSSCGIYIIPVLSADDRVQMLNKSLNCMAQRLNCSFVDVMDIYNHEKPCLRFFSELTYYMREGRMSFSEAMHSCNF